MRQTRSLGRVTLLSWFAFWLKTSRPGLWFPTLWLYLLPVGGTSPWENWKFWAGLVFASFPLNLIVYGWNDVVDTETDRVNPRKNSWLFGAVGTDEQLRTLPPLIAGVGFASAAVFTWLSGPWIVVGFAALAAVLYAYNHPTRGLRGRPPLELCCQAGYLLVVPLSILVNDAPMLPLPTWLYLTLFALQSHLVGEVMDIPPDRAAGRRTTATELGTLGTKWLIIGVVTAEVGLLFFVYKDLLFGSMLLAALGWLLLDVFWLFRARTYSLLQMKIFGVGANVLALGSMLYVWWSRCLLEIP